MYTLREWRRRNRRCALVASKGREWKERGEYILLLVNPRALLASPAPTVPYYVPGHRVYVYAHIYIYLVTMFEARRWNVPPRYQLYRVNTLVIMLSAACSRESWEAPTAREPRDGIILCCFCWPLGPTFVVLEIQSEHKILLTNEMSNAARGPIGQNNLKYNNACLYCMCRLQDWKLLDFECNMEYNMIY